MENNFNEQNQEAIDYQWEADSGHVTEDSDATVDFQLPYQAKLAMYNLGYQDGREEGFEQALGVKEAYFEQGYLEGVNAARAELQAIHDEEMAELIRNVEINMQANKTMAKEAE